MADDNDDKTDEKPELPGSTHLKAFHKALYKALRCGRKALGEIENPGVRDMLTEHTAGVEKACSVLRKGHGKLYKDHPMDDDDVMAKAMDDDDASYGEYQKWLAADQVEEEEAEDAQEAEGRKAMDTGPDASEGEKEEERLELDEKALTALSAMNDQLELMLK